jgi:hypothetical protein
MKSNDHSKQPPQEVVDSMVPNTAAIDKYTAPDSTALRPNPESLADRPRVKNQTPSTAVEADLKQNR